MLTKIREGMSGKTVAEIIDGNFEYLENKQGIKFEEQNTYINDKLNGYEEQLKELAENKFVEVDEDDLTIDAGKAKFTDREYIESSNSGMGYKILRRKIQGDIVNILTQEDFDSENTIYEIRYKFDLNGSTITLPNNSVLKFDGGQINNGIINLNNAVIEPVNRDITEYITATINGTFKAGQAVYDEVLDSIKYWDGEDWRNTDGTLVSKVTII